jgi:hypothetical protein
VNHYEVLGVAPDADVDEIRQAYLAAARLAHPDLQENGDGEARLAAEARMRSINLAWGELADPRRRRRYDAALDATPPEPTGGAPAPPSPAPWRPYDPSPAPAFDERHDRPITGGGIPTWLRLAPVLSFATGVAAVVLGAVTGIAGLIAVGLACLAASVVLFVAAPLVALTTSRRGSRLHETDR